MKPRTKDSKQATAYPTQLTHLCCWLIIATNLLSCGNWTHAISSNESGIKEGENGVSWFRNKTIEPLISKKSAVVLRQDVAVTGNPYVAADKMLNATIMQNNLTMNSPNHDIKVATVSNAMAGVAAQTMEHTAAIVDNIALAATSNATIISSNTTFNENNASHLLPFLLPTIRRPHTNTYTQSLEQLQHFFATTMAIDLPGDKGYATSTTASAAAIVTTASSNNIYSNDISLNTPPPFNHSQLEPISFHENCLEDRNSLAHVFTVALYSVVCVVGLFGNTLVIWVVFRFSKMQTVTNIYILNLAIADESFLIGIPFLLYTMRICSWKFGEYVCKAYMVSTSITQFTSSIFLLIMAADRYIAVCHPIESPKYRTIRIAKLVSMFAWITSAILMMPVILFASTVRQEDGINYSCNIDWPEVYKTHSGATFILYTFLLGFAAPLCFILIFYYLVIRKLRTVQQKHKSKEKKRSHRKVTRLVLTVITVYILCWLPHWISQVSLINSFVSHRKLTGVEVLLFLLFGCLAYSNSAMNPILYAFLSDNFRKSFSKAFSCVTAHEVEAQLINEHSFFTHKRSASAAHKRKSSRRLSGPRNAIGGAPQNNSFLAPTVVHNSGNSASGGSGAGGASSSGTSASTATTATDKSTSNSQQKTKKEINGGVICATTRDGEKITLVVNHEASGVEQQQQFNEKTTQNQTIV